MEIKQVAKSRTINFNALIAAALPILKACGIVISPELVVPIITVGNILLRFMTDKGVHEK